MVGAASSRLELSGETKSQGQLPLMPEIQSLMTFTASTCSRLRPSSGIAMLGAVASMR